ncbi:CG18011 [Drosophila busckii]|uniref:CG18011 n=1 Tax=Drosophila busckii TaxID=30019 RepID=A0A0M3QUG2_DROBS|nr:zinc finger protein 808 [Drosophila busckii]ALC40579.1 CG18011 [Drosophila busckii]
MSENSETRNKNASCLHCRVHNSKLEYQEIFDEVGTEIGLPELILKYFDINVKPNAQKSQLLCQECVNTLIRFFDIDELQREQDAANAAKSKPSEQPRIAVTPVANLRHATKEAKSIEKQTHSPSPQPAAAVPKTPAVAAKKLSTLVTQKRLKLPVKPQNEEAAQPVEPSKRMTRSKSSPKALPKETKAVKPQKRRSNNKDVPTAVEQEQISDLIRDILNDDEAPPADKVADAIKTVSKLQAKQQKQQQKEHEVEYMIEHAEDSATTVRNVQAKPQKQQQQKDEVEYMIEHSEDSTSLRNFGLKAPLSTTQSQDDSLSEEGDSIKVEPFNFVLIKETDDIGDLYDYLDTVVKTCFESLSFEWATVCRHCSLKCSSFEALLAHMLKSHKLGEQRYKCPIEGCPEQLKGRKFLAMHLVVLHAPVADIPIYGSCPECHLTFSNILQYNKHSCAHVIKKRRGVRLYCEMCGLEFPSWKRFNFHNQFHLERHRPRACFVCNYADTNIDDLFQHLHYAHEPEGTLFCDLCDRNFRDASVLIEHNKSHANVSSNATNFRCTECNANFETRGRLNGHMRIMHGSVISCELCSREFSTEATFNIHMKKHLIIERDLHVCNNCGLLSDSQSKLLAHVENEVSPCFGADHYVEVLRDAYVCEYCSAYYKQKTDLRAHRDSGAHKDGLFWCQPCNKEFTDMKFYRHHLRNFQQLRTDTAHRKLEVCLYYMCDFEACTESYVNWNSLYTHKRRTHDAADKLEPKPKNNEWICQFCQKECRSKMSLSVHVARSHNNNNVTCPICKSSYKDEEALKKHHDYWHEPIECSICSKMVKNRRNFDTHVNVVHSNNKRYACGVCKKGFYHKSEMEAHQRLHAQLFGCDQCSFTTRHKKSLSVHVLGQHFKRFGYECKSCDKRFGRHQGLLKHMQRVHGSRYLCSDFYDGGCKKVLSSVVQLKTHVRKVHNSQLVIDDDSNEATEQQTTSDADTAIAAVSPAKKRSVRIDKETHVEFIGDEEDMVEEEEEQEEQWESMSETESEIKQPQPKKKRLN